MGLGKANIHKYKQQQQKTQGSKQSCHMSLKKLQMRIRNFWQMKMFPYYEGEWGGSHKAEENCYILFHHELNITESVTANIKKICKSKILKLWHQTKGRNSKKRQTFRNERIVYITESIWKYMENKNKKRCNNQNNKIK